MQNTTSLWRAWLSGCCVREFNLPWNRPKTCLLKPQFVALETLKVETTEGIVQSWFGPCMCVCRPSCAAPAATPETRKRCSPSASTCSATNVSRCVTTPDRGSAPSATVPSAPTTSTASTSPNPLSGGRRQQTEPKRGAGWREASGTEEIFNEAHTLVGGGDGTPLQKDESDVGVVAVDNTVCSAVDDVVSESDVL